MNLHAHTVTLPLLFGLLLVCKVSIPSAYGADEKLRHRDHPSVKAAMNCSRQIGAIVKNRHEDGPDISCDIPIKLSEQDLDEMFKAALRTAKMSDKWRGFTEKYSASLTKTLTNFRAADCLSKLRIKRAAIISALKADRTRVELDDQPVVCDVTTKKHKIKKLKFSFSPVFTMQNGCVKKFELNMGKIDADCRVCYFNRLYLSTKLVSLWANHMAGNVKKALNRQLGRRCH